MADFKIGKVNSGGNGATSADASGVSNAITRTQSYLNTVSNQRLKEEFLGALKIRQEQALAINNKIMFDLCGKLINATKEQDNKLNLLS